MESSAPAQPDADEVQQKWLAKRQQSRPTGAAKATATTDPADELQAKCLVCAAPFRYVPIRAGGKIIVRRTLCDRCADQAREEEAAAESKDDGAKRERRRLELLETITGNAAECRGMTFEAFDTSEAGGKPVEVAKTFVDDVLAAGPYDGVRGLYLWGDYGTGKTHLVVAIVDALLAGGYDPKKVLFDRADELITRIQDTYNTRESTMAVADRRKSAGVWILDDLGTEQPTPDAGRHLRQIISRRVLKPTLITSNLSPADELEEQNPELGRVASRLGPRFFRVLELPGPDRRFRR